MVDNQKNKDEDRKRWYVSEHLKNINSRYPHISKIIDKFKKEDLLSSSSLGRTIPIEISKLYFGFDHENTTTIILTISIENNRLNYAYIYISPLDYIPYVCYGVGLQSLEGEYRSVIVGLNKLEKIKEPKFTMVWNKILNFVEKRFKKFTLSQVTYGDIHQVIIPDSNILFAINWFIEIMIIYKEHRLDATSGLYSELFKNDLENDKNFISKLVHDHKEALQLEYVLTHVSGTSTIFGQKIIPVYFSQIREDIIPSLIPEIDIMEKLNNLTVNLISPSFPLFSGWFYISNRFKEARFKEDSSLKTSSHENAKDFIQTIIVPNQKIERHFQRARVYSKILNDLRHAQELTYKNTQVQSDIKEQKRYGYPGKFSHFSLYNMYNDIDRVIQKVSENVYINSAVCIISEYVGFRYADVPYLPVSYQNIYDPDKFSKCMFELLYALYCMNSRLHLMHGDMSPSNVTLREVIKPAVDKPVVLYIINEILYMFPFGEYMSIIDFSNTSLTSTNVSLADLMIKKYGGMPGIHISKSTMKTIKHIIEVYPTAAWKVLTAMDIMKFIIFIRIRATKTPQKPSKKVISLIDRIYNKAYKYISQTILTIGNDFDMNNFEYPNLEILKSCFSEYAVKSIPTNTTVVDIYNYNNDIKYSLDCYKNFPPNLKQWYGINKDGTKYEQKDKQHNTHILRRQSFEKYNLDKVRASNFSE